MALSLSSPAAPMAIAPSKVVELEQQAQHAWRHVLMDFDASQGGDYKILRAIGRTATVNLTVAAATLTGGAGYLTGGAIAAKRVLVDGVHANNDKEVAKGLAVFSSATTASIAGQLAAGAVMVGVVGASLPVAATVAFGVGCTSGITAGALSEWGVDSASEKTRHNGQGQSKEKMGQKDESEQTVDTDSESETEAEVDEEESVNYEDRKERKQNQYVLFGNIRTKKREQSFLSLFFQ